MSNNKFILLTCSKIGHTVVVLFSLLSLISCPSFDLMTKGHIMETPEKNKSTISNYLVFDDFHQFKGFIQNDLVLKRHKNIPLKEVRSSVFG